MKLKLEVELTSNEAFALSEAIKAYRLYPGFEYDMYEEIIHATEKIQSAYADADMKILTTTPQVGDWVVLERYDSGKIMRSEYIGVDGFYDSYWVNSVVEGGKYRFERLWLGRMDIAQWELVRT